MKEFKFDSSMSFIELVEELKSNLEVCEKARITELDLKIFSSGNNLEYLERICESLTIANANLVQAKLISAGYGGDDKNEASKMLSKLVSISKRDEIYELTSSRDRLLKEYELLVG